LNKNSYKNVPCYRVVRTDGSVGGYARGTEKKVMLLRREGIKIRKNKIVDFEKVLFKPKFN
jgi:alkylated DNA nucleotide flippase Atl1